MSAQWVRRDGADKLYGSGLSLECFATVTKLDVGPKFIWTADVSGGPSHIFPSREDAKRWAQLTARLKGHT